MHTLTDGIDLGCVTTTVDTDTDVDVGELVKTNNEQRLIDLKSENLWLHKTERRSVDLDKTTTGLSCLIESAMLLFISLLSCNISCEPCSGQRRWLNKKKNRMLAMWTFNHRNMQVHKFPLFHNKLIMAQSHPSFYNFQNLSWKYWTPHHILLFIYTYSLIPFLSPSPFNQTWIQMNKESPYPSSSCRSTGHFVVG